MVCRVPRATDYQQQCPQFNKTLSLTKILGEQTPGLLNELVLIWGLNHAFLLSLPKQRLPVLLCLKLSKQKSQVATLPGPLTL